MMTIPDASKTLLAGVLVWMGGSLHAAAPEPARRAALIDAAQDLVHCGDSPKADGVAMTLDGQLVFLFEDLEGTEDFREYMADRYQRKDPGVMEFERQLFNRSDQPAPSGTLAPLVRGMSRESRLVRELRRSSVVIGKVVPLAEGEVSVQQYERPVPIGVPIRHETGDTGTLGCRVRDKHGVYVLSNNHVLNGDDVDCTGKLGGLILQPGYPKKNAIGKLVKCRNFEGDNKPNWIDAAIAKSKTTCVRAAAPNWTPKSQQLGAFQFMGVLKHGAATEESLGRVLYTNATVCFELADGFVFRFVEQIVIAPSGGGKFCEVGDSGSLVVQATDKRPVGMLFAKNDATVEGQERTETKVLENVCVANHIKHVLGYFDVTIDEADTVAEAEAAGDCAISD